MICDKPEPHDPHPEYRTVDEGFAFACEGRTAPARRPPLDQFDPPAEDPRCGHHGTLLEEADHVEPGSLRCRDCFPEMFLPVATFRYYTQARAARLQRAIDLIAVVVANPSGNVTDDWAAIRDVLDELRISS